MNDDRKEDGAQTKAPLPPGTAAESVDKVTQEFAEQEFERFAELMDLDTDYSKAADEDKADMEGARDTVIRALRRGSLVVEDDGELTFTPTRGDDVKSLRFYEPQGQAYMDMDHTKKGRDMLKTMKLMVSISTAPNHAVFAKMFGRDLKVCLAVLTLFLG